MQLALAKLESERCEIIRISLSDGAAMWCKARSLQERQHPGVKFQCEQSWDLLLRSLCLWGVGGDGVCNASRHWDFTRRKTFKWKDSQYQLDKRARLLFQLLCTLRGGMARLMFWDWVV